MKYGLYLPNFGDEVSALTLAELAVEAETAGWDGFFLWDHILYSKSQKLNIVDPWVTLTAVAMKTTRLHFGTTLTPVCRRRPWQLARETTTLYILSGGRLILSVGLGDPPDAEFASFGEDSNPHIRAEKLDEGLDILAGLWSGRMFSYQGKHYQIEKVAFRPVPVQKPRIPIWVGGFWPNQAPFRRAARWDGVLPLKKTGGFFLDPQDLCELMAYLQPQRASDGAYDVAMIGTRSKLGRKPTAVSKALNEFKQAGATWWLQSLYMEHNSVERMRVAICQGPPA